jgi:hypothetical protein
MSNTPADTSINYGLRHPAFALRCAYMIADQRRKVARRFQ